MARPLVPHGTDIVNTAHRHDDPLNFVIAAHGELLVMDPGYGTGYSADSRYSWYLTPLAHNLILVDGDGPPRTTAFHGDCRRANTSQADGRVVLLWDTADVFGATAETRYRGVDFQRHMFFVRGRYFVVVDDVESPREHRYSWLVHGGGAAFDIVPDGASWPVGHARLTARILSPSGMSMRYPQGWHAHDEDHNYIRAKITARSIRTVMALVPDRRHAAKPELTLLGTHPVAVLVRCEGEPLQLFCWHTGDQPTTVFVPDHGEWTVAPGVTVVDLPDPQ
jgi:hypothetical protein